MSRSWNGIWQSVPLALVVLLLPTLLALAFMTWLLPTLPALAQDSAIVPVPRAELDWWMPRFYDNVRRIEQGDVDVLFVGDSITHGWESRGAQTWERYYGHRKAVNMGFAGDRTQHVLWRLVHGRLDGIAPKVAVLMIGTNNVNSDTPREIAAGVGAVCYTLRAILPETKILLLAIFPRGAGTDDWRRRTNEAANAMIAELDDGEWIHYLDIGDAFLEPDGTLPEAVMPDLLHPSERGYEIWAEAMEPTLAQMLGDTPIR